MIVRPEADSNHQRNSFHRLVSREELSIIIGGRDSASWRSLFLRARMLSRDEFRRDHCAPPGLQILNAKS
jgi:hypothetical protein